MEQVQSATEKKSMSVREMGRMLGLKKVESYWLVHKEYFETVLVGGKMRVVVDSFEEWYRRQFHYKKVDGEAPGSDYAHTLSVQEFADLIGVSGSAAYSLVDTQGFETTIINGRKQLFKAEVYGWIETHPTYKRQSVKEREEKWLKDLRASIREEPLESEATPLMK